MIDRNQFEGCLLGLALGDALGAPLEGGPLERLVWRLIGTTRYSEMRWTDDTQMSLDLAESLLAHGRVEPDDLAQRFAASYRWSRGYGPGSAGVLRRIRRGAGWREANRAVHPRGSYGNGGAMRSPVVGLFYAPRREKLADAAWKAARVTHAHELGAEGAVLVAEATACAALGCPRDGILAGALQRCTLTPFRARLELSREWLDRGEEATARQVRRDLGNGTSAAESCVTAIYCALRFLDSGFLELQRFVGSISGDVDTIGSMAGAIWGAANGVSQLPPDLLSRLEQGQRLATVAAELHSRSVAQAEAT